MNLKIGKIISLIITVSLAQAQELISSWHWNYICKNHRCIKSSYPVTTQDKIGSTLDVCQLTCGKYGSLWPIPTGPVTLGNHVKAFHPSKLKFDFSELRTPRAVREYLQRVSKIFQKNLLDDCGVDCSLLAETEVVVHFSDVSPNLTLGWDTDESYTLSVLSTDSKITVKISSKTVYGARHALETLSQLTTSYSPPTSSGNSRNVMVMISWAKISDAPKFPHRGLMLDSARHFLSIATIQRTLDAMAMVKMNVMHWHVSDTQSFSLETPKVPLLTKYGAYSADKIYTVHDTASIIEYAKLRGIRVIIEIDAPAHAGNGWQWGESANLGKLAVCINQQPWRKYCIQPPCGQLNPVNPNLYKVLKDLYTDIIDMTPPGEALHMGGDEVFFQCWNSSSDIISYMEHQGIARDEKGFLSLWGTFQKTILDIFDLVNPIPNTPVILWSSHLTDPKEIENFLDKNRYIIEVWDDSSEKAHEKLLSLGYKIIMAAKDKWYLDHGFWGVSKYHSWKTAYDYKLIEHKGVLGGETCMWTELADDHSVDVKIWPRAAAVAERFWANPRNSSREAESRLQFMRQRLIKRGINADPITMYYCYQNEEECL